MGFITGQGTKILHPTLYGQKIKIQLWLGRDPWQECVKGQWCWGGLQGRGKVGCCQQHMWNQQAAANKISSSQGINLIHEASEDKGK